jgi:hypothetical protein
MGIQHASRDTFGLGAHDEQQRAREVHLPGRRAAHVLHADHALARASCRVEHRIGALPPDGKEAVGTHRGPPRLAALRVVEVVVDVEPVRAAHLGGADREAHVAGIGGSGEEPHGAAP